MYFIRINKAMTNVQSDPIPAKEPKRAWKVVGIGACILAVGLVAFAALGRGSTSLDSGLGTLFA